MNSRNVGSCIAAALQAETKELAQDILDDVFSIGDAIEVEGIKGIVSSMSFRNTQIRSFDGRDIFIPNAFTPLTQDNINDRFLVSKDDIINLNYINLKKISDKYDKKNILIIHFKSNSKIINYKVYLSNKKSFKLLLNSSDKNFNLDSFFTDIIPIVTNQWKINNLISTSTFTSIECNIKTLNIYELKNIKNLLKSSTLINEIILKTISLNSNSYFINYYGNEIMLINSLNRKNINISIENNICNISLK